MNTSKEIDMSKVLRVPADTLSKNVTGEEILLNLDSGTYFGLDSVGTFIWQRLQTDISADAVLKAVTEEFEVDPQAAEADLREFLLKLFENGLIEYSA